jgi:LysM repeat protein
MVPSMGSTNPMPGMGGGVATNPLSSTGSSLPGGLTGAGSNPVAYTPTPVIVPSNPPVVPDAGLPTPVGTGPTEYTIAQGDTFGDLARKFHVKVKAIEAANPGVNSARLKVGQKIKIPAPVAAAPSTGTADSGATSEMYTVKQGDVLARIAKTHNTTVTAIQELNHLKSSNIRAGQKLKMPAATAHKPVAAPAPADSVAAPAPGLPATGN